MCKIKDFTYVCGCSAPKTEHKVEECGKSKGNPATCPLRYPSLEIIAKDCASCEKKKKEAEKKAVKKG
jgi:hypothetical protein